MDMEVVKFGFQVLQFLLTGGLAFYVYMSNKDKVTNDRITVLEKDIDVKLDEHSERIAKVEVSAEKSPTHDDLSKLHEKINEVAGGMRRLEGELAGMTRTLQLIHETMMERK